MTPNCTPATCTLRPIRCKAPRQRKFPQASKKYNKKITKFTGANVGRHHRLLSEAVGLSSSVPAIPSARSPTEVFLLAFAPRCATIGPAPFTGRSLRIYRSNGIRVCPPFCGAKQQCILLLLFPGQPRGTERRARGPVYLGTSRSDAGEQVAQNRDCKLWTGGAALRCLLTLYQPSSCNACGKFHHACEDQPA